MNQLGANGAMPILRTPAPGRKPLPDHIPSASAPTQLITAPAAWTRSIPGEELTTSDHVFDASQRLVAAGLSVIPIEAYKGTKAPDSLRLPRPHDRFHGQPWPSWSAYKMRRPRTDELRRWFEIGGSYGLAVLGGA